MKSVHKIVIATTIAVAITAIGSQVYAKKKAEITRNEILNVPMDGLQGYDGVMYVTDIPPGMEAPRHLHPGYEFNYILKGSVSYQPDGGKEFTLKVGQGAYNPANHIHKVWNPSKTEPAQLVAVLIKEHGKPLAIPAP